LSYLIGISGPIGNTWAPSEFGIGANPNSASAA